MVHLSTKTMVLIAAAILLLALISFFTYDNDNTGIELLDNPSLEVIQSNDFPVPENTTRRRIIREYLADCKELENSKQKVDCLDAYYVNNFNNLKEDKESCEGSNKCIDDYYFMMGNLVVKDYCDGIEDDDRREECLVLEE